MEGQVGSSPSGADFQAIVSGVLQAEGADRTETWLSGPGENAKVYQNNIATMKAVNAGEVPMGIMYHYYWYRDQALTKEGSANTKLHYFKGEDVGAFVSVSAGGVPGEHEAGRRPEVPRVGHQRQGAGGPGEQQVDGVCRRRGCRVRPGAAAAGLPAGTIHRPFTLDGPEVIKP